MTNKRKAGMAKHERFANVYSDLGYPDADRMLVKAKLIVRISEILRQRDLTQAEAAEMLELTQPKISAMLRGRFRGFSERKLIDCLTRLGCDVEIVIRQVSRRQATGKVFVTVQ